MSVNEYKSERNGQLASTKTQEHKPQIRQNCLVDNAKETKAHHV